MASGAEGGEDAMKPTLRLSLLVTAAMVSLPAQTPKPSFEVASVKRQLDATPVEPPPERPSVFYRRNATAAQLIRFAFNLHTSQVIGGPDWITTLGFEINARPAGPVSERTMRLMVRSLLEDRFRLISHIDRRDMPFASLRLARSDRRLGEHLQPCDPENPPPVRSFPFAGGARVFFQRCAPLSSLVAFVAGVLGTPVVDETGLAGYWAYDVSYVPSSARLEPASVAAVPLPIALREQLGLQLESTRGALDVLTIESIQQPTDN